ncbi:MAG TPA: ribonuclease III [Candidatus Dormibacteraeota bacterium]|nr:ribonuclease III [Candidatus Dormibacteraeota bacterium]
MAGENRRKRIRELLARAGVRFAPDFDAIDHAFAHESYAREFACASNERLEFLGDSVLGAIAASWLFETFPDEPEGELTLRKAWIVNDAQIARTAGRLGFSQLVFLGAGMRKAGGAENTSILADAFEAFVGALYLRYGMERARRFVLLEHVERLDHESGAPLDAKTRLQHLAQAQMSATPAYYDENRGTPQLPAFFSRVEVNGRRLGSGTGSSKKIAQQAAAQDALLALEQSE